MSTPTPNKYVSLQEKILFSLTLLSCIAAWLVIPPTYDKSFTFDSQPKAEQGKQEEVKAQMEKELAEKNTEINILKNNARIAEKEKELAVKELELDFREKIINGKPKKDNDNLPNQNTFKKNKSHSNNIVSPIVVPPAITLQDINIDTHSSIHTTVMDIDIEMNNFLKTDEDVTILIRGKRGLETKATLSKGSKKITYSTESPARMPTGIYTLTVEGSKNSITKKFTIN